MRLKILLSVLTLVIVTGTYFYGHNKGSMETRLFVKQVVLPLCYLMTPNDKEQLTVCLDQNL
jgi:uncharacterized membrane protein affecting hemolysin expression